MIKKNKGFLSLVIILALFVAVPIYVVAKGEDYKILAQEEVSNVEEGQSEESSEGVGTGEDNTTDESEESDSEGLEAENEEDVEAKDKAEEAGNNNDKEDNAESEEDKNIKKIKETLESEVESKSDSQYASAGFINEIGDGKITLDTGGSEVEVVYDEDVTEIFKLENGKRKEREIDDLQTKDYISVSGPYIEGITNANLILIDTPFVIHSGKIIEVNEDDYYVKIITLDKSTYTIDVEEDTLSEILNIQSMALEKIGFSKLKEGDTLHVTAVKGWRTDQDRYSAHSILIIPQEYFQK